MKNTVAFIASILVLAATVEARAAGPDSPSTGIRYMTIFESPPSGAAASTAERSLIAAMLDRGATFIDEAQSQRLRAGLRVKDVTGGAIPDAISPQSADVIIAAIVRVDPDQAGGLLPAAVKMVRNQATIEAMLVAVDTGEVLATKILHGIGIDTSEVRASQLALQDAGKVLAKHIFDREAHFPRRVELLVEALPLPFLEQLRGALLELSGVKWAKVMVASPELTKIAIGLESSAPSGQALAGAIDRAPEAGLLVSGFSERTVQARYSPTRAVRFAIAVARFSGPSAKTGNELATLLSRSLLGAGYLTAITDQPIDLTESRRAREARLSKLGLLERDALFLSGHYLDRGSPFFEVDAEIRSTRPGFDLLVRDGAPCPKDQLMACMENMARRMLDRLPAALVERRTTGSPAAQEALFVREMILDPAIFPARGAAYAKLGVGRMIVENRSPVAATKIRLRASVAGLAEPGPSLEVPDIAPGARAEIKIPIHVGDDPKPSPAAALRVELGYEVAGRWERLERSPPIEVLERYALDWREPESIAAFVTDRADSVRDLANAALSAIPADKRNDPLACAAASFAGLSGLGYQRDAAYPGRGDELDDVALPVETLARRRGDCEDLAVLLAAIVEASGSRAILILTPSHVMAGIDTEVPAQSSKKISLDPDRVVIHKGRTFVPVETTKAGGTFAEAWREAAATIARAKKEHLELAVIDVRDARERFSAAGFKTRGALGYKASFTGLGKELEALAKERESAIEMALSEKSDLGALNAAELSTRAMLLLTIGRTEDARAVLNTALSRFPQAPALSNNLANVELARGDMDAALALYERALAKTKERTARVRVHLNAAIAAREKSASALSHAHVVKALDEATTDDARRIVEDFLEGLGGSLLVKGERSEALDKSLLAAKMRSVLDKPKAGPRSEGQGSINLRVADIVYWLEP